MHSKVPMTTQGRLTSWCRPHWRPPSCHWARAAPSSSGCRGGGVSATGTRPPPPPRTAPGPPSPGLQAERSASSPRPSSWRRGSRHSPRPSRRSSVSWCRWSSRDAWTFYCYIYSLDCWKCPNDCVFCILVTTLWQIGWHGRLEETLNVCLLNPFLWWDD